MAKTIKGSELIKALEEGELKAGQQVKFTSTITSETKIAIVTISASGLYCTKYFSESAFIVSEKDGNNPAAAAAAIAAPAAAPFDSVETSIGLPSTSA